MEFPLSLKDSTLAFQTGYHNLKLVGRGKDQDGTVQKSPMLSNVKWRVDIIFPH